MFQYFILKILLKETVNLKTAVEKWVFIFMCLVLGAKILSSTIFKGNIKIFVLYYFLPLVVHRYQ